MNAIQSAIDNNSTLADIRAALRELSDEEFDAAYQRGYSPRSLDGSEEPEERADDPGLIAWTADKLLRVDSYADGVRLYLDPREVDE